jgi:ferredoxin-NADP reductase/DMSO/TMAO reductase YedYZ heme-binding membrane subunit
MHAFSRIIASRLFAWMALVAPGIVLLVIPTLTGELGVDPLKELFHRSGEIAVWTLGTVLCLSPLKTLFPRNKLVSALNRHRRSVGVTAFIYALLHVNLNFIYEGGIQSYVASILEPFFLAGTFGFLILLLLTATSNEWSVRKMGFGLWKWVHRLAYLAALVLFYHQGTAGQGNWGIAFVLFIPVASLEALRIGKPIVVWGVSRFNAREKGRAWTGWREFALEKRVAESATITSFYLRPEDGRPLQSFRPGQFLTIQVAIPGQQRPATRTYTLSDSPNEGYFRLSVKRELQANQPAGLVSNWLHDHFNEGAKLLAKAPTGQFYLDLKGNRPVVLISAGVGVTPMISMLNALTASQAKRPIFFFHGARNRSEHAFACHVRSLASAHENIRIHFAYSRPSDGDLLGEDYDSQGRIGIKTIQALMPNPYGDFFLCGPTAFMKEVCEDLAQWGVEIGRIHFEFFGPSTVILGNKNSSTTDKAVHQIQFYPDSYPVTWDGKSTLLEAALSDGLKPKYGCRSGVCGTCACKLLRGKISYVQAPAASTTKDTILLCSARPESDITVDLSPLGESRARESKRTHELPAAAGLNYRCFRPQS